MNVLTVLRSRSWRTMAVAAGAATCLVWLIGPPDAGAATEKRFLFTGAQQFFAVPDGVTNLHVVAIGGRGGRGGGSTASSAPGGFGAVATADISVTPGEILLVNVGGNGGDGGAPQPGSPGAAGYNGGGAGGTSGDLALGRGGGGGGGMSELRPAGGDLTSALVIAAGGAGAGGGANGGGGGNAANLTGGNGAQGAGAGGGAPGSGATPTGPGPGGVPGGPGQGGAGQNGANLVAAGAGGGGGGGVFGGNGGITGSGGGSNGGGGGAGAGLFSATRARNTSYVLDNTGVPSVTLTYDVATGGPGGGGSQGGGGGGTQGGGGSGRPVLSALRISPSEFVPARRGGSTGGTQGTTVTYRASVAASTTFSVLAPRRGVRNANGACVRRRPGRRGRPCTRYVSIGAFRRSSVAGFNTFTFTGRVNGRRLRNGRYKLQAVARTAAGSSRPVRANFRVVR
jgi:hypothetical protein